MTILGPNCMIPYVFKERGLTLNWITLQTPKNQNVCEIFITCRSNEIEFVLTTVQTYQISSRIVLNIKEIYVIDLSMSPVYFY